MNLLRVVILSRLAKHVPRISWIDCFQLVFREDSSCKSHDSEWSPKDFREVLAKSAQDAALRECHFQVSFAARTRPKEVHKATQQSELAGQLFSFGSGLRDHTFFVSGVVFWSKQDLNHQDGCADDNRAIGDIEVWPDILTDIELQEVDHVPGKHSIPQIAQGTAENQRQCKRGAVQSVRVPPQQGRDDHQRQKREEDEKYNAQFRRGIGEQSKGSATIRDVRKLEKPGNDLDAVMKRNCPGDDPFAEAVESEHDSGDQQNIFS
jgi:hypothetical protein